MSVKRGFIDTNVLVYALSEGNEKAARAAELRNAGGVISVQVLNELVNVLRRKLKHPWPETLQRLMIVKSLLEIVPLTLETHEAGLELARRYSLSLYDAMIVASALEAGCDALWSEDMQDGLRIGDLTIRNPFRRRP